MSDISQDQSIRLVGYFPAEAHKQNYDVDDIPARLLTQVIYAFAGLQADGTCVSVDTSDDNTNFPLLSQLKQQYPDLQILISVGGAHATAFPDVAANETSRTNFVKTAVQFMTQNGFDGIDIDWEFPGPADSANFTTMLQELRSQLDAQGEADGRYHPLTIAAPAGKSNFENIQLSQIHQYLAWINLMTYDFTVVSSKTTDFGGPLRAYDPQITSHAAHNVDFAWPRVCRPTRSSSAYVLSRPAGRVCHQRITGSIKIMAGPRQEVGESRAASGSRTSKTTTFPPTRAAGRVTRWSVAL